MGDTGQWDVRSLERTLENVSTRMPATARPVVPIGVILRAQ